VSNCAQFLPCCVLVAVSRVPEIAGLVVGVGVQDGAPSVIARVGVEVGRLDGLVDVAAVVLGEDCAPPLEILP
jgi:hypothetical protein